MRRTLLPLIAALALVAGGLALTGAQPTDAHRRECPTPTPAGEAPTPTVRAARGHDNDDDEHERHDGKDKHKKQHCKPEHVKPTATPTGGQTPTPTPSPIPSPTPLPGADVKVQSVTVTVPSTATAGVMFSVLGSAALHNNGPDGDVNVDTTFTLHLPADCTITNGTVVLVPNRSVPMSVPVTVSRAWNATCTQAGPHQFVIDATVATSPGQALSDPNLSNNTGSGTGTTNVN